MYPIKSASLSYQANQTLWVEYLGSIITEPARKGAYSNIDYDWQRNTSYQKQDH